MGAEFDGQSQVLVIGAGPAGSAAAITLAQAGVDVCVVDRAHFPRPKTCGDALSNGAMALLDGMGAGQAVRACPHAVVRHASVVFPSGQRIGRDYSPPGYIVPRLHLDDALRRQAQAAGARLLQGVTVRALQRDAAGAVTGATGPQLRWRAGITIAADGPFSLALSALGSSRPPASHLAVAATAYMRAVSFPVGPDTADHYLERALPGGYGWIFPEVDGLSNMGVYQRSDRYAREPGGLRAALDAFIARHPERFASAHIEGRVHSWSLPLAAPPHRIAGSGLLLAGDAACLVDPLSGEGIWQALYSGVEAATTAIEALRDGGGRGLSPELMGRYEREIARRIGRPSQGKRLVQQGLDALVTSRLYRLSPLLSGLRAAYAGGLLEITKRG